jgi:hypothetical protein
MEYLCVIQFRHKAYKADYCSYLRIPLITFSTPRLKSVHDTASSCLNSADVLYWSDKLLTPTPSRMFQSLT